jgi:hypothetical protein
MPTTISGSIVVTITKVLVIGYEECVVEDEGLSSDMTHTHIIRRSYI